MAGEIERAARSYLRSVLADGVRPFRYRSRVRALLGLPEEDGVQVSFARPLPGAGFVYAHPQLMGEFYVPDELLVGPASSVTYMADEFMNLSLASPESAAVRGLSGSDHGHRLPPDHAYRRGQSLGAADQWAPTDSPAGASPKPGAEESGRQPGASHQIQVPLPPTPGLVAKGQDMVIPDATGRRELRRPGPGASSSVDELVRASAEESHQITGESRPATRGEPQRGPEGELLREVGGQPPPGPSLPRQQVAARQSAATRPGTAPQPEAPEQPDSEVVVPPWTVPAARWTEPPPTTRSVPGPGGPTCRTGTESPPTLEAAPDHPPAAPIPAQVVPVRQVAGPAVTPYAFWERRHLSRLRARILR